MKTRAADVRKFAEENWNEFAAIVGQVLSEKARFEWGADKGYKVHFAAWQRAGVTILPNHFYSPIPDLTSMGDIAKRIPCHGIDFRENDQLALLQKLTAFQSEYLAFESRKPDEVGKYRYGGAFPKMDAEIAYAMTRLLKPKRIVEIGTGFSTLVFAEALRANMAEGAVCEFTSIDPYVSWSVAELPPGSVNHLSQPVELVSPSVFESLGEGDFLFIDSSHVWRPGNDVDFEYFHLLPRVNRGVIVHIHDIFLPYPYPPHWLTQEHVFWNEQMILAAFLTFNPNFQVILANNFLGNEHFEAISKFLPSATRGSTGGSFWMRRV